MKPTPPKRSVPKKITRRDFVNAVLATGAAGLAAAAAYPVARFMEPPQVAESPARTTVAAHMGELHPNSGKVFPFGASPAIIIRKPDGDYVAFTAVCTHLQCTVQYRKDLELIWCPCHNGRYDLNGQVVSGPPPLPLEEYSVNVRGDEIVVTRGKA